MGEFDTFGTTGNRGFDEFLRRLENRIRALESAPPGSKVVTEVRIQGGVAGVSTLASGSSASIRGDITLTGNNGVAVSVSGQDFQFSVSVPIRTDEPSSPANGDFWYRSDLNELHIRVGGATKIAAFA